MDERWNTFFDDCRADLVDRSLLRRLRALEPVDALRARLDGRPVVLFSSNDYLGLSSHRAVREAAASAATEVGLGHRGAALICGHTTEHEALAADLAAIKGTETALVFPTGYAANLTVLTALGGTGATIFSDAMNHASIIDGCRLARARGAEVVVYDHADPAHLDRLLAACPSRRKLVVTDTVFSMDGDVAPLAKIVEVKNRHGALLAIDEAHAMLVIGKQGGGVAEAAGVRDEVDVHVGTLGKAIGAHGGFAATSRRIREHLVNRGRPFIFSTALPLPVVAAARAALRVFGEEPEIRARLRARMAELRAGLGLVSESAVFKVVLGDEDRALAAAERLLEQGWFVPAIRPPTVPAGTSRLRITLSAGHTADEVRGLVASLVDA
jgi:8-amino-7-oxononanoate synthase